ncbi:hypothetical protein QQ045_006665 [Rhodiola kirilowii]
MDTLGALALATERPTKELMDKAPVGRTAPLITNVMWRNLLAQSMYQITILLTLQFKGRALFDVSEKVKDTLIFNIFVLCQVFNEFNARKLEKKNVFEGIHKNKLFLGIIAVTPRRNKSDTPPLPAAPTSSPSSSPAPADSSAHAAPSL